MKISLTRQLVYIYVLILVVATLLFGMLLNFRLNSVANQFNYARLDDHLHAIVEIVENGYSEDLIDVNEDIEFVIGSMKGDFDTIITNTSFDIYEVDKLIEIVMKSASNKKDFHGKLNTDDGVFYFSSSLCSNGENFVVAVSTGEFIINVKTDATLQIFGVFALILTIGILIIASWSKVVVDRINNIKTHVVDMPNNNYSKPVLDKDGHDEVYELARSIEDMRLEIFHNEQVKQEILQNVSHDLKTPLAVIKSYAEAIGDNIESIDATQIIIAQANTLQYKVEQLLQLNRLAYLQSDEPFENVRMDSLINTLVDNFKYLSELEFILDLDDTEFKGYYENLYTVVENILDNSMRYAKNRITITLKNGSLSIHNDGEHIDEKFIGSKFKAYEKGSKGKFGVGMSIVQKTLEFFDLKLDVQNEEVGVTFTVSK